MIVKQFKEALADILWGDEIEKIIRSSKKRDRGRIGGFAEAVRKACGGNMENIGGIPLIPMASKMPGELLWQSVLYRMIANEAGKEDGAE